MNLSQGLSTPAGPVGGVRENTDSARQDTFARRGARPQRLSQVPDDDGGSHAGSGDQGALERLPRSLESPGRGISGDPGEIAWPSKALKGMHDLAYFAAIQGLKDAMVLLHCTWPERRARRAYKRQRERIIESVAADYLAAGKLDKRGVRKFVAAYSKALNAQLQSPDAVFDIKVNGDV